MHRASPPSTAVGPSVEIVLPVLNEQAVLAGSVHTLTAYLTDHCPYPWQITIADNGSTDSTRAIAFRLASTDNRVSVLCLAHRGRGLALRTAWLRSGADILAYMDIDLSTDLAAFLPLIAPLASGKSQIATGSRLLRGAQVTRGVKRELISRCYNLLIHLVVPHRFADAQCGFKALRRDTARELLPLVENNHWFFDTELLLAAEERGEAIHEVPVRWVEDTDTRVHIARTAREDIAGLARVRWQRWQRRLGIASRQPPALPVHE